MPRLTRDVPKCRKHKVSGQAIVTISGRDYYLNPIGTKASHLEYDRLITKWLATGRSTAYGTPAQDAVITELIVDYLEHARVYYGTGPKSVNDDVPCQVATRGVVKIWEGGGALRPSDSEAVNLTNWPSRLWIRSAADPHYFRPALT